MKLPGGGGEGEGEIPVLPVLGLPNRNLHTKDMHVVVADNMVNSVLANLLLKISLNVLLSKPNLTSFSSP